MKLWSICIALSLLAAPVHAWDFRGHRTVVAILNDYLSGETRTWVENCLAAHPDPRLQTMDGAAVWPDLLVQERPETQPWHYINVPFGPAGGPPAPETDQVVWAIEHFREQAQVSVDPIQRAEALAYLIHLVGDIHQPLHANNYYGPGYEHGDQGGGKVPFVTPWSANLHQFWDSAAQPPEVTVEELKDLAVRSGGGPDAHEVNFRLWADESHAFAVNVAYPSGAPPAQASADYLERARQLCLRRLFLAGLRLSYVLEKLGPGAAYH
ncbi:MAG: S1/P1 nuclease [Vulcanimicrobiota bacterium]